MASDKVKKLAEDIQKLPEGEQALVGMVLDAAISADNKSTTDVFAHANNLLAIKEELYFELFFFSKNYVAYATRISKEIQPTLEPHFLDGYLEALFEGAETGMVVRDLDYSDATKAKDVLYRTDLNKIQPAAILIDSIENHRDDIEFFNNDEHDFKNMKGIVVRITHQSDRKIKMHAVKMMPPTRIFGNALQIDGDTINRMATDVVFKIPTDNQVMIINNDIFIFNIPKFEKAFNYSYTQLKQADTKAVEFNKKYKISVPSDMTGIEGFFRESNGLVKKFLNTNLDLMTQEQLLETAEEMAVELMEDDSGAIILMDKKDLSNMLDVMNDSYYESKATGIHYLASSKKAIDVGDE